MRGWGVGCKKRRQGARPTVVRQTVMKCYAGRESLEIQRNVNRLNFEPARASNPVRIEAHTFAL